MSQGWRQLLVSERFSGRLYRLKSNGDHLHILSPSGRLEIGPFLFHWDKAAISGFGGCNGIRLASGDILMYIKLFSSAG